MARDMPIGNGNVLINFDAGCNIRDIYYPHVGQENHALDHLSHFGIWTEEGFFWIDSPDAVKTAAYETDTLVTDVKCRNESLGISLEFHDAVDHQANVFIRRIAVNNEWERERKVKLYFHLDLHLYGTAVGDTVYYDPELCSLVFYKGHRYISLSCGLEDRQACPPSSYATGQKEINGLQGTWKDAEDGQLGRNPIAQGSVDGTIELELIVPAKGSKQGWFWLCFAQNISEVQQLEQEIRSTGPEAYLERTRRFWRQWLQQDRHELELLPDDIAAFYKRSLLIIRTNMDNRGAILAANDSDIMKFAKDTYSYMWPRDGALISHALDRAGYYLWTRPFFDFCKRSLSSEGYLLHKYNPDGSAGSSWHPWVDAKGKKQLPIQEDETALVLFALWHHHRLAGTIAQSGDDYERFVIPAADFLIHYRDASGLPLPSYDLWEERYGVFSFTTSTVHAGLLAAANFAEANKDPRRAELYGEIAGRVKDALEQQLYSEQEGRFLRGLYWNGDKEAYEPDLSLDASMYALFDFGLFPADDPRIVSTMQSLREKLWVRTDVGGMARYANDYYHQISGDIGNVPGNPWYICTLWYAEWLIAMAKREEELSEAEELLRWTVRHALPTGILAEQIHPYSGEPLSVSPLTWSHSTYVKVIQEYLSKLKRFGEGRVAEQDLNENKLLRSP